MPFDKTKLEGQDGKYKKATDEDFDAFVALCDAEDGWNMVTEDKKTGTKVWDKSEKGSDINMVRVFGKFPETSAAQLYDTLHDPDYRKVWDENMIEGKELEELDDHNDVGYYSAKAPRGTSNRDFVNQRMWRVDAAKGELIIMNHSVVHKDRPDPMKGFIRAISIRSGYLVRGDLSKGASSCEMIYITQADMMGWVPSFAMNYLTKTFAPKAITKLVTVSAGYDAWKAEHNPDDKPWRCNDFDGIEDGGDAGAGAGKDESSSSSSD